jgi:tryptophan 2,3-dioxygenase
LKEQERTTYGGIHYQDSFTEEQRTQLNAFEDGGSLFEMVNKWLERMPFLEFHGFNFLEQFMLAVRKMFSDQRKATVKDVNMHHTEKDARLEMIQNNESFFWRVLDQEQYQELLDNGTMKLSYKATMAALLINLYQDEPIMQMPFNMLDRLLSIDELWTTWRYRHAQMTMGMLGKKPGTGGSSGHDYLRTTANNHHVFKDFHNITTLLIPRTARPELPKYIKKELGFYHTHKD